MVDPTGHFSWPIVLVVIAVVVLIAIPIIKSCKSAENYAKGKGDLIKSVDLVNQAQTNDMTNVANAKVLMEEEGMSAIEASKAVYLENVPLPENSSVAAYRKEIEDAIGGIPQFDATYGLSKLGREQMTSNIYRDTQAVAQDGKGAMFSGTDLSSKYDAALDVLYEGTKKPPYEIVWAKGDMQ